MACQPLSALTFEEYLETMPPELRQALSDYVLARWLQDSGEYDAARPHLEHWQATLRRFKSEPRKQRKTTRTLRSF